MMYLLVVFLPIAAAIAVFPIYRKSVRLGCTLVIAVAAAEFAMALSLLYTSPADCVIPGFCGLGITFTSGSFRTVMALIAAFMWLMTALVSPEYFRHAERVGRYYCFYLWTLGALMGVFLAGDLMTLFIFFEIMSFTSYVWVVQNETPQAIRASETYLFVAVIGGLTMLMGLFLLYFGCGSLTLNAILEKAPGLPLARRLTIGLCILTGFGAKAGMFPLHIWLPKAHPVAPAPASALLSGILTKSGIFGVVAITCWLFEGVSDWGNILLVPAVITMVLGAVLAVFSTDLKRTLACSSMSQIGFILTGISMSCLLGSHGSLAAYGSTLHVLNHSLIKLTLFVAAGVVYLNVHSLDLNDVRGFGRGKPLLLAAFLSGACSIAGIPGFSGYVSKTLLHESIVEYIHHLADHGLTTWPYTVVEWLFLFSGGLTFAYMARLFYILFLAPPSPKLHANHGSYMEWPTKLVLSLGGLLMPLLGLTAHSTMEPIAHLAVDFFRQHEPSHSVHYFAWINLKGAVISIAIGCAIFYLVGWRILTRRENGDENYVNRTPALDMEDHIYRPLLRLLSLLGGALARLVETITAGIIFGAVDLLYYRARKTVTPSHNEDFAGYTKERKHSIVQQSFSSDLLFAAIGMTVFVILVLVIV